MLAQRHTTSAARSTSAPAAGAQHSPPGTTGDPLPCPLCDYDLRGLTEPRCPECGHRFDWRDFTDPSRQLHPYLFEHHPRRNARSFVRTLAGGLRPRAFWATLRPIQPSRPDRLVTYWLLANLLLPVGAALLFLSTALAYVPERVRQREARLAEYRYLVSPEGQRRFPLAMTRGTTAAQYVDFGYAPPLTAAYFREILQHRFDRMLVDGLAAAAAYVAWPWLTLAALLIFQASMRRARVNEVHVLRCALYSCDAGLWVGMLVALLVPPVVTWLARELPLEGRFVMAASVVFAGFTAWRLAAAYRLYLRFDHPVATAVASQVLVLLTVMVVAVFLGSSGLW